MNFKTYMKERGETYNALPAWEGCRHILTHCQGVNVMNMWGWMGSDYTHMVPNRPEPKSVNTCKTGSANTRNIFLKKTQQTAYSIFTFCQHDGLCMERTPPSF